MATDLWMHRFAEDPKAVENTIEDEDFDPDNVAAEIGYREPAGAPDAELPDDFEDLK